MLRDRRRARQQPEERHRRDPARAPSPASPASPAAASRPSPSRRSTRPSRAGCNASRAPGPARRGSRAWSCSTRSSTSTSRRSAARRARNPATYTGAFQPIRDWFAGLPEAKARGYGRPVQLQRQGRPLRGLPGRRPDQDRDALPAGRLRHLRRLPRQALQPRDAGDPVQGQVDRRRARHDGRGGRRASSRPCRSIRDKMQTLKRVGLGYVKVGQSATTLSGGEAQRVKLVQGAVASAPPARPSTSSTSRPPACTSRTSRSCWRCSTSWSTRATRSW